MLLYACTHIHEQGQASDPLHGQDEEGDHGEVPAIWVALYPGQHLLQNWILGPAREDRERLGVQMEQELMIHRERRKSEWEEEQIPLFKVLEQLCWLISIRYMIRTTDVIFMCVCSVTHTSLCRVRCW